MSKIVNVSGQRFGSLTIIKRVDNNKWGRACWLCICDCGNKIVSSSNDLQKGDTKSCGCFRIKHGHSKRGQRSKVYQAWDSMIQRCNNPNFKQYKNYGGRGITVSRRWMKFENFLKDMGEPPSKKHSIDRINNNKGYYKSNCRWATAKEQARNRCNNTLISYGGKTLCLTAWAEELGVRTDILSWRLNNGWSTEKMLATPVEKRAKRWNKQMTYGYNKEEKQ